MVNIKDYITIDKEIMSGAPVFKGTRVPVETLFEHIENGVTIDEFIDQFPSVKKEQAKAILEIASRIMSSKDIEKLYETAAG